MILVFFSNWSFDARLILPLSAVLDLELELHRTNPELTTPYHYLHILTNILRTLDSYIGLGS
jgi:hypothetical protein